MQKSTFKVSKMDCPSEVQLIRMKLDSVSEIEALDFDIPQRRLTVVHKGSYEPILQELETLKLDTSLLSCVLVDNYSENSLTNPANEKRLLWQVLGINVFFFLLELTTGFLSGSMGLVADSLDMLADSFVYGMALLAVGGTLARKKSIAKWAGYLQLLLAVAGLVEVIRRFALNEVMPSFQTMIGISALALIGNSLSLYLLQKSKSTDAHMQASMIFTSNDVIVNLGVILAGVLVYLNDSTYPDLIVGTLVFVLVAQGAYKILKLSK